MCILCGQSSLVDIMIIDKNSSNVYCPNCLIKAVAYNLAHLVNNPNLNDDITGKPGAILFVAKGEEYCLNRQTMIRLIETNLKPEEWKCLHDKYVKPAGTFRFMLHGDFYDEEGNALQPKDLR